MKKMNNKGFAITTLLYGLLSVAFLIMTLLMGIMSTNRQNTAALIERIEDELNRYGESETTLAFAGEMQEYVIPYGQSGWYKIELWGAKTDAGNGDYASGVIYLPANTMLYFYLGEQCTTATDCASKFNKGNSEVRMSATPAGGMWNDTESIRNTIMRASGTDSSFISGMSGMNSVKSDGSLSNNTNHYSGKFFINGLYVDGANTGNGKANVEIVSTNPPSEPPTIKNSKLNNVRYIKTCTSGRNGSSTYNQLVEVQAINLENGSNVAKRSGSNATDGLLTTSENVGTSSPSCKTVDLGAAYNLSEIGIWYNDNSNSYEYLNHQVAVSTNNSSWTYLKNASGVSVRETAKGQRFTKWNPDVTDATFPAGNYYIFSAGGGNNVLTAVNKDVSLDQFKAEKTQKWTIEPINVMDTYVADKTANASKKLYKIYEAKNLNALQINEGTAENGEYAKLHQPYRGYEWDIWEIIPGNNGTYQIKSLLGTSITASSSSYNANGIIRLYGNTGDYDQKWILVNAEH